MPRSDEAAAFFHAVYTAVQEIPHGKVTSYGHIAKLIGTRPQDQAASLLAEGVTVTMGTLGELMVDLGGYGWFPSVLPSEAGLRHDEDDSGDSEG
ncbi:hypothetical protein VMCG_06935 [Cytospora schulzeri]|uniref:Methylated-DNA-[protein]-cysteine S-methyltransferase DNA binding domain-containing protein n=1 Tax=Cytospora schulzeri TaxID=448051 RepID=A0A423W283_9PEZI|nr:hypothetical protein VMCG_06935 [Valsa malicola]